MNTTTSTNIVLRNSSLTAKDIPIIIEKLHPNVKVFSLSYNNLGDKGIVELCEKLPVSIEELGLVHCNICDVGGEALLEWIKKAKHLKMVCIEQNNFSSEIRDKFIKESRSFQLFI